MIAVHPLSVLHRTGIASVTLVEGEELSMGCNRGYDTREFSPGSYIHPSAGPINVTFDSAYRKGEGVGDFSVGQALGDEGGNLAFAISQWQRHGRRQSCRGGGPAFVDQAGGSAAGGQGSAASILPAKDERGVRSGVGCSDSITHCLEIVRDGQQRLAYLIAQCGGPAGHQPRPWTFDQLD
jgi:hypothetical protein